MLEIFPTPGHSPGHQSMLCRLESGPVLLMGDATYLLPKMRERLLPAICWSPDAMVASWELIEWLERREGAMLLCSHDQDFRERVKLAPAECYE